MSGKLKYVILCGVLVGGAMFGIGYYVGTEHASIVTSMVLTGSNALDDQTVLNMLDQPDVEAAKKYLNSAVDANVLELHALLGGPLNDELSARARTVLATVARSRRGHTIEKNTVQPDVDRQVQSILDSVIDTPKAGNADR